MDDTVFNFLQNHAKKTKAGGGGGKRKKTVMGVWCNAAGEQRHIKAACFGIEAEDKILIVVKKNKIVFVRLNDAEAKKMKGEVYRLTKDSANRGGTQSYINISDDGLWLSLCDFYGVEAQKNGKWVKVNGSFRIKSNAELFAKHEVLSVEEYKRKYIKQQ